MEWRCLKPLVVYVVAHLLDVLRNQVSAGGLVLASLDFNAGGEVSRKYTDAGQSFSMKS